MQQKQQETNGKLVYLFFVGLILFVARFVTSKLGILAWVFFISSYLPKQHHNYHRHLPCSQHFPWKHLGPNLAREFLLWWKSSPQQKISLWQTFQFRLKPYLWQEQFQKPESLPQRKIHWHWFIGQPTAFLQKSIGVSCASKHLFLCMDLSWSKKGNTLLTAPTTEILLMREESFMICCKVVRF